MTMDIAPPLNRARESHLQLGPIVDHMVRGGLISGLFGFGLGGFVPPVLNLPFVPSVQWAFTGCGFIMGIIGGVVWSGQHRF